MKWTKKKPTHRFLQDSDRIIIHVRKKKHCSFCRTDTKKCQQLSLTYLTPFLEWTKRSLITVSQHPQKTVLYCTAWGWHVLLQTDNFLQGQWRLMRRGGEAWVWGSIRQLMDPMICAPLILLGLRQEEQARNSWANKVILIILVVMVTNSKK